MVEGEHRVCFAATKVGLQFDNGIAPLAGNAKHGLREQTAEPFGDECATKEFGGVLVFVRTYPLIDLPKICCEFGLLITAGGNVWMWRDDLAPRLQSALRFAFRRLE